MFSTQGKANNLIPVYRFKDDLKIRESFTYPTKQKMNSFSSCLIGYQFEILEGYVFSKREKLFSNYIDSLYQMRLSFDKLDQLQQEIISLNYCLTHSMDSFS